MKKRLYNRLKNSRIDMDTFVAVVCIILAVSVMAVPAVAQSQEVFTDTFEDGNVEGWEGNGQYPTVVQESTEGNYSAYATSIDEPSGTTHTWEDGPLLDLTSQFEIKATVKSNWLDATIGTVRYGISSDTPDEEGTNAFLIFNDEEGKTYLGTYSAEPVPTDSSNYIADSFTDEWVNIEIYSSGGGQINAKVWRVGTSEPEQAQLTRSFDPTRGVFGFNVGNSEGVDDREAFIDSVEIEGVSISDPTLRLDTGNYLEHGETQSYTVYDLIGEREIRNDVTSSATVTSGNTSVITVNENTNELTATTDESVSTRVNITADYDGRTAIRQVTVAEQSIENLEVLPFLGRTGAMFLDRGFQMILVGLLLSVAATRVGGVYAGLGIYQMSLTAGWLIGWVPIGLAFVGLFSTLFIGLNIAANIDYSVRR